MKFSTDDCLEKLKKQTSYDAVNKVIYGWVKTDKINPKTMAELIEWNFKSFRY